MIGDSDDEWHIGLDQLDGKKGLKKKKLSKKIKKQIKKQIKKLKNEG